MLTRSKDESLRPDLHDGLMAWVPALSPVLPPASPQWFGDELSLGEATVTDAGTWSVVSGPTGLPAFKSISGALSWPDQADFTPGLANGSGFTVLMRLNCTLVNSNLRGIFGHYSTSSPSNQRSWLLHLTGSNRLSLAWSANGSSGNGVDAAGSEVAAGDWHTVAATYVPGTKFELWFDGAVVKTVTASVPDNLHDSTDVLRFGRLNTLPLWQGEFDSLLWYPRRALTDQEIVDLSLNPHLPFESGLTGKTTVSAASPLTWAAPAADDPNTRPTYMGFHELPDITDITPKITCCRPTGTAPFALQVSADMTTYTDGVEKLGYKVLDFAWDFGDEHGRERVQDYYDETQREVNANDSQRGGEATYVYRRPGTYTVTLTATAMRESDGQVASVSTTDVLRLEERNYFDGGATGGTWTITVNGETTANIAYDADADAIATAIAALPSLSASDVEATLHDTILFVGSLAGTAPTISANFSGLTGENGGNGAPQFRQFHQGSTNATVTVSDYTGWSQLYFDSNADDGGDGTAATPYNDAATLLSQFSSDVSLSGDNHVCWIKSGSTFALTSNLKIGAGISGVHFRQYGPGAKPILKRSAATTGSNAEVLLIEQGKTFGKFQTDIVVDGIEIPARGTSYNGSILWNSGTNGPATEPLYHGAGLSIIDSHLWRSEGEGEMVTTDDRTEGIVLWRTHIDNGLTTGVANYNTTSKRWVSLIGNELEGVSGDSVFNHNVYPACPGGHLLFRYNEFKDNGDCNYAVNTTAKGGGANRFVLFDGNKISGTNRMFDLSNVESTYTGGDHAYFDDVVIQANTCNLPSKDGINVCSGVKEVVLRHNSVIGGDRVFGPDSEVHPTESFQASVTAYDNVMYGTGRVWGAITDNWYMRRNKSHTTGASHPALEYDTGEMTTGLSTWDIDYNTWYAPSATEPFEDQDVTTYRSFAYWQGTLGFDTNGAEADPGFYSPSDGVLRDPSMLIRDSNGWSKVIDSSTCRKIYVSNAGSDSNDGLSTGNPKLTVAAGFALMRDGEGDQLYLNRGDSWNELITVGDQSGESGAYPAVIGAYGTGARPQLYGASSVSNTGSGRSDFFAFLDIDMYCYKRDPNNVSYAPGDFAGTGFDWKKDSTNILVEGCKIHFFKTNITFNGQSSAAIDHVWMRRCVIADAWSDDSHAQGLYTFDVDEVTIEENVFDHNGFAQDGRGDGTQANGDATIFNHSMYIGEAPATDIVIRKNILTRGSSHGCQMRPGGVFEDNLVVEHGIGILSGGGTVPVAGGVNGEIRNNVIMDGVDVNTSEAKADAIHVANSADTLVEHNYSANSNSSIGTGEDGIRIFGDASYPSVNVDLRDNVWNNWDRSAPVFESAPYVTVRDEIGNHYYDAASASWTVSGTNRNSEDLTYIDPSRTVGSYAGTQGDTATTEGFIAEVRLQEKTNWRPAYEATSVNDYIKGGFAEIGIAWESTTRSNLYRPSGLKVIS